MSVLLIGVVLFGFGAAVVHKEWNLVGFWLLAFAFLCAFVLFNIWEGRRDHERAIRNAQKSKVIQA